MDSDKIVARFPDEIAWQEIFESIKWRNGRYCVYGITKNHIHFQGKVYGVGHTSAAVQTAI